MLCSCNKYSPQLLQRTVVFFILILFFAIPVSAQTDNSNTNEFHLNPLLLGSFKKPVKANLLLTEYIKPTKYELMRWPNYPLTPAQIAERDKRYDRPIGQQILSDAADSYIKAILSGKKTPVAVRPKF